jgi:hypothetical protein
VRKLGPTSPPTSRGSGTTTTTGGKSTTPRSPTTSSSAPSGGAGVTSPGVDVMGNSSGDGAKSGPRKFMSNANLKERRSGLMRRERSFPSLMFWRKRDARKQHE